MPNNRMSKAKRKAGKSVTGFSKDYSYPADDKYLSASLKRAKGSKKK